MQSKVYEFLGADDSVKMVVLTADPKKDLGYYARQHGVVAYREYMEQEPTVEQMQADVRRDLTAAVQFYMDKKAREYGYDSVMAACTYASSTNKRFAAQGQAFVQWRDEVWGSCYEILADVLSGGQSVPTVEGLLAQLPEFVCS